MRLRRLTIENFKRFRAPLELSGFAEGLNLFVAPNESGKSTVAEAIRAAFFERHKSGSVGALRPWSDGTATPTVEIEFDIGGRPARLQKAFLGKKRCTLDIDGNTFDGTAAEDHLAGLLGFSFAGKGASSPEHMGIPGLLWIRQGTSHEITRAVSFASDHLRNALGDSLGELAASSGDEVIKAVEAERNALLTPATEAPRGPYLEAIKRRTALDAELAGLRNDIEVYRAGVDRLAGLRRAHDRDDAEHPWLALREQLARAQSRLDDARSLSDRKAAQDGLLKQFTAQVDALRGQLQSMARDHEALGLREAKLSAARDRLLQARHQLHAWEPRQAAAVSADSQARANLQAARQAAAHAAQEKTVATLRAEVVALTQNHEKAHTEQRRLARLQAEAEALAIPPDTLGRLRASSDALHTAQARLDAVSTALEFELQPGATLRVGQKEVTGSQRLTVVSRTGIDIDGIGRITILPGGGDLERLAGDRDRRHDEQASILQSLGLASLAAAEERERLHAQGIAEARSSAAVLAVLAPDGLDTLASALATQTSRLAEATRTLDAMTAPAGKASALPALSQAESAEAAARTALDDASRELNEARLAVGQANAQVKAAEDELDAVRATLSDPLRAGKEAETSLALTDALAHQSSAQATARALSAQLETANLSVLQQDVERLERSARQIEAAHAQRATDITRLEADLEAKGALGLEEVCAEKQSELEQVERRCGELERRAKALSHLLKLLHEKRAGLARRLQAPLQRHLNHYLQILFPGARIEVDEDLSPGRMTREGANGAETGGFEALSLGTREQMGVVARLAYADLLKAAGKPTLLILDDALVHTDQERLGQMKRVLYDAAARHQILIFSCHPQAWQDLGVAPRSLA